MPVRILITAGTVADCTQAATLIEGLDAQYLLADKGYDTDAVVAQAEASQMAVVIPPKKIVPSLVRMIEICTGIDIWWKTRFCISSVDGVLQPVTPRTQLHSWRLCKYAASRYGALSYDDTI